MQHLSLPMAVKSLALPIRQRINHEVVLSKTFIPECWTSYFGFEYQKWSSKGAWRQKSWKLAKSDLEYIYKSTKKSSIVALSKSRVILGRGTFFWEAMILKSTLQMFTSIGCVDYIFSVAIHTIFRFISYNGTAKSFIDYG